MSDWKAAYREWHKDRWPVLTDAEIDSDLANEEAGNLATTFKGGYERGYEAGARKSQIPVCEYGGISSGEHGSTAGKLKVTMCCEKAKPPADTLVAHVRERCLRLMDEAKRRGVLHSYSPHWGFHTDAIWGTGNTRLVTQLDIHHMSQATAAEIMEWLPRAERWAHRQWEKRERGKDKRIRKARRRMMKSQGVIPPSGKPFVRDETSNSEALKGLFALSVIIFQIGFWAAFIAVPSFRETVMTFLTGW